MHVTLKRVLLVAFAILALPLIAGSAFASGYYDDEYAYRSWPIYRAGSYYGTYAYGYSGWDYHRIYYRYHYPYSTSVYSNGYGYDYNGYGGYGQNTRYLPYGWSRWQYAYPVNPGYVGYPTGGYYW